MKFDIDAPPAALVSTQLREAPGAQLKNPERLAWLVMQIFYGEFDGNRRKRVLVKIIGE